MSKLTIGTLVRKVSAELEKGDRTPTMIQHVTGLGFKDIERAINYMRMYGFIENRGEEVHLRPAVPERPAPGESPAEPEPVEASTDESPVAADVETIVIDGWTCYLTYKDLLPPLTPEERAELQADIEQRGILVPLLLSQTGQDRHYHVLDGANRLEIAAGLGLKWMDIPKNYRNLLTPEEREQLALDLNLHRRHLMLEQRRDLALRFRQKGMSYRQIADKLGVSHPTVMSDIKDAAGKDLPPDAAAQPETITGMDGKSYPAAQPISPTQTAEDAEDLVRRYAGQTVSGSRIEEETGLNDARRHKAINLLETQGKVERDATTSPGDRNPHRIYKFVSLTEESAPVVESEIPSSAEVPTTAEASAFAVGDYVTWRFKNSFDHWVGIVRQISTIPGLFQVEAWTMPGDGHDIFVLDSDTIHPCTDNEYERTWTLSTRQDKKELLCVEWKDHYLIFDGWDTIEADAFNYHPREKWDIGLAARVSRESIDHYLAQGGQARVFKLDDLNDRMKDIVGKAGRARGGKVLYPKADSEPSAGDQEPERPAYQAIPGSGSPTESSGALTIQVAIDLIIDALRQSERPLGRGELRKYAGIREEDREACEQAIDAMLEAGSLAEVQDGKAGRRYHFPDMLAKLGKGDGVESHRAFVNALRDLTDDVIALVEQPYNPAALDLDEVQVAGTRSAISETMQKIMTLNIRLGEIDAELAALKTSSEESASAGA